MIPVNNVKLFVVFVGWVEAKLAIYCKEREVVYWGLKIIVDLL